MSRTCAEGRYVREKWFQPPHLVATSGVFVRAIIPWRSLIRREALELIQCCGKPPVLLQVLRYIDVSTLKLVFYQLGGPLKPSIVASLACVSVFSRGRKSSVAAMIECPLPSILQGTVMKSSSWLCSSNVAVSRSVHVVA